MTGKLDDARSRLLPPSTERPNAYYSPQSASEDPGAAHGILDRSVHVEQEAILETSTLGRNISWQGAYILTVSRVLGSGIFATPGIILSAVGSPGLALCLWILGALVAYFGVTVSLEFGCMLPRSGGEKVYLEFTYPKPKYLTSILVATQAILLKTTASNCLVFAQYLLFSLGHVPELHLQKWIAATLLTAVVIIHACFMRTGIAIQNFLGWIKIGLIIFMIIGGPLVIFSRSHLDPNQPYASGIMHTNQLDWSWNGMWSGTVWSWGSVATSFLMVYYSYVGLDNVNYVLNEVKDPVRTVRSSTIVALLTVSSIYVISNVAFFMVVPLEEAKNSKELIAALFFERVLGDTVGRRILPALVALSAAGNVMVVTFAMARLTQEIGRTGLLPFSHLLASTAPFGSPLGGLILYSVPSLLVIIVPSGDLYSFILQVEGYPAQITSFAIAFGLIHLRHKHPLLDRPYRAWLPGVWSRIVLAAALLLAPFFPSRSQRENGILSSASYALVGTAIVLLGMLYWYLSTVLLPRWRHYQLEDHEEILDDGTAIRRIEHVPAVGCHPANESR